MENPINGFLTKKHSTGLFFSLPDLFKLKVFRHLQMTRMGFAPPPHKVLKKVDENFSMRLGKFASDFLFFLSENI